MAKNTAPNTNKNNAVESEEDEWVKEQIGFPPYWNPKVGDSVQCMIQQLDTTDEEFPRYIAVYTGNSELKCYKGAKETEAFEEVIVYPGEQFSMSEWAGIDRNHLAAYVGIEIRLTRGKDTKFKGDDGKPRTFINWELMVKAKDRPVIEGRKQEILKLKAQNQESASL